MAPAVPEFITITRQEYNNLVADSNFLGALEEAGVDNWEGYSEACKIRDGEGD